MVAWELGGKEWWQEWGYKGTQTFEVRYVHHVDCSDGFTGVEVCQNLSDCILKICTVQCMTIMSQ